MKDKLSNSVAAQAFQNARTLDDKVSGDTRMLVDAAEGIAIVIEQLGAEVRSLKDALTTGKNGGRVKSAELQPGDPGPVGVALKRGG